jgi:hypothetical protein
MEVNLILDSVFWDNVVLASDCLSKDVHTLIPETYKYITLLG